MHNFPLDTLLEYMGPNSPASLPYAHSHLFSYNEDDHDGGGSVVDLYPAVRELRHTATLRYASFNFDGRELTRA